MTRGAVTVRAGGGARKRRIPRRSEKDYQAAIVELAKAMGWLIYHPWLSIHSTAGWPDLALCKPPRLILAECKVPGSAVRPAQQIWLEALVKCPGLETYLWVDSGDLRPIANILTARPGRHDVPGSPE